MNNLYKKIEINGIIYIIILEGNNFIKCISDVTDEIRTFNFDSDNDINEFVKERQIKEN